MDTIWTYQAEDFLLFSADVYRRLFLFHNADFWWIAPLTLALAAIVRILLRAKGRQASFGLFLGLTLGIGWVAVGGAFLLVSYRSINWAAPYFLPLFVVEGFLLSAAAIQGRFTCTASRAQHFAGGALLLYGLLLHPIVLTLLGRPVAGLEFLLIAPDPTAIASLGLLLFGSGWLCRSAFALALLWCGLSWLILDTLGLAEAFVLAGAVLLAIISVLSAWGSRKLVALRRW